VAHVIGCEDPQLRRQAEVVVGKLFIKPKQEDLVYIGGSRCWLIKSTGGHKVATIYESAINGHGADFSGNLGGPLTGRIVPGSPLLPLTKPEAKIPLTWDEVADEVVALLRAHGWQAKGGGDHE
jgi:hypothetical protein